MTVGQADRTAAQPYFSSVATSIQQTVALKGTVLILEDSSSTALTRRTFIQATAAVALSVALAGESVVRAAPADSAALARIRVVHDTMLGYMTEHVNNSKAKTNSGVTLQMPTVMSHYFGFWPDDCLWPFIGAPGLADTTEMQGAIGFLTDSIVDLHRVPDRVEQDGLPVLSPGGTDAGPVSLYMPLHLPGAWARVLSYYESFGVAIPRKKEWANIIRLSFDQVPFANGLVYSDPQQTYVGFGFHDTCRITGWELMTSMMLYRGLQRAATVFKGFVDDESIVRWNRLADGIPKNIYRLYDNQSGGYLGGSHAGHNFSVWANGLAYFLATPDIQAKIVQFYKDNQSKIFVKGCTRQMAEPGGWTGNNNVGGYQNGGYWATGTGFILPAIYDQDPEFAADLAEQLVTNLPATGFPEWLDGNGNPNGATQFLAAISIPLIGLDSIVTGNLSCSIFSWRRSRKARKLLKVF